MGRRFIVKIKDKYLEWSTVVDAPITDGMSLEQFKEHYRQKYGESGYSGLEGRLERVEQKRTSAIDDKSVEDTLSFNRAGSNETELTLDEIYRVYCLNEPDIYGREWWNDEEE